MIQGEATVDEISGVCKLEGRVGAKPVIGEVYGLRTVKETDCQQSLWWMRYEVIMIKRRLTVGKANRR